jgi:TIR domain
MTEPNVVSYADIGQLTPLTESDRGRFFFLDDFHLPGTSVPLAYKEFTREHVRQARAARAAIEFRATLDPSVQPMLDERTAWPRALVERSDSKEVSGFLLPLLPKDHYCRLMDPVDAHVISTPRMMTWLISTARQRKAAGIDLVDVDKTERLMLLAQLSHAIGLLHGHDWVFGDLHFGKVTFALNPPRIKLLGCAGAATLLDLSRRQGSAPFWEPPELVLSVGKGTRHPGVQDKSTDVYKLGLAILRSLTPGQGASMTTDSIRIKDELDDEGAALVAGALSPDRLHRPAADELCSYLSRIVSQRIGMPETLVIGQKMPEPLNTSGGHVFISYVSDDAEMVDNLQGDLERAGVVVWRDRTSLGPGDRWKDSIRHAIADGAFFICCFSEASRKRTRSYMNQELSLAVEELQVRDRGKTWFLPVIFPGGQVPDWPIGPYESLRDFHHTVLSPDNWARGISDLVRTVRARQSR